MAGRRATRRTTPQPQPLEQSMRPSRTTRSKSRELAETIPPSRKLRQASVESTDRAHARRGRSAHSTAEELGVRANPVGLQNIAEEKENPSTPEALKVETLLKTPPFLATSVQAQQGSEYPRRLSHFYSPGAYSQLDGSTAISSFSLETAEAAELDPNTIIESIQYLYQSSSNILQLIGPAGAPTSRLEKIYSKLQRPDSMSKKAFSSRCRVFERHKEPFGGDDDYLRLRLILRAIQKANPVDEDDSEPRWWGPHAIIYKANVATFAQHFLALESDAPDTYEMLRYLDHLFPGPFMSLFNEGRDDSDLGASALLDETFQVALEIRTQLVILFLLRKHDDADYNPERLLLDVFFGEKSERDPELSEFDDMLEHGTIRGWDLFRHVEEGRLISTGNWKKAIDNRTRRIREALGESNGHVNFDLLREMFSWKDFLVGCMGWISQRNQELDAVIHAQGGVEQITYRLRETFLTGEDQSTLLEINAPEIGPPKATQAPVDPTPSKPREKSGTQKHADGKPGIEAVVNRFKFHERRVSGRTSTGTTTQETPANSPRNPTVTEDDDGQLGEREEEAGEEAEEEDASVKIENSQTAKNLTRLYRQLEKHDKENVIRTDDGKVRSRRFIDAQPNAKRVTWDSSQVSEASHSSVTSAKGIKRLAPSTEQEDSESQDEGFQIDRRVPDINQRRKRASPRQRDQSSPSKRRRIDAPEPRVSDDDAVEEEYEEQYPRAVQYLRIKKQGHQKSTLAATRRRVRGKISWRDDEVDVLIQYIEDFGPSWSLIKTVDSKDGDVLRDRDQVALKDKARNIKYDYLKSGRATTAGVGLPRNFEQVTLGKKYEDRLRAQGIDI